MISRKMPLVLLILVLVGLLGPAAAHAQTPTNVIVIYPAAEPQADSLALSVFFVITDELGRPISRPGIDSVEIELLGGGDNVPVEAKFTDPQTPFYIALILDASGSMASAMPGVREAAQAAVDSAPAGANIAVIKFNKLALEDNLTIVEPFTPNLALVKGSINAIEAEPNAPTCLYNTLYKSIELLDEITDEPQERQAIIVFTDGKDDDGAGNPCSQRKYEDVINRATLALPITPIHTIGLCADEACSNLRKEELRSMAKETSAFAATGSQNNMSEVFREIMEGLSSQLVARANVYARQGDNQAALSIKLQDNDVPLTTTFSFFSPQDYNAPPPPANAQISNLVYDQAQDIYTIAMSVTSPETLQKVVVELWDEKSGTQLPPAQEFENPEATLQFERNTDDLVAGREYSFRVKAVDKDGFLITIGEEGETILAKQTFVYEPPPPPPPEIIIKSVQADFQAQRLFVDLESRNVGEITSYQGFIVDKETGAGIYEFGPTLFPGNRIEEQLPERMEQAGEPRSYVMNLTLIPKEGPAIKPAQPYEFKAIPPPPPSLLVRVGRVLQNPAILISIFVIVLCTIGLVIYLNRPAKKEALLSPMPRPPIDHTMISGPSAAAPQSKPQQPPPRPTQPQPPRLHLEILETPGAPPEKKKVITTFPFVIGRDGSNFNIPGDQTLSRQHVEISVRDNKFFITDLESRNGTYIGQTRLPPRTPTPLGNTSVVRLGHRTQLKLDLQT
ncbi:MAG: FHA domain-containing protein [Anaerolineae bacterium]|nr:FHA domain-containing protein [Anaerolineae bacterium]